MNTHTQTADAIRSGAGDIEAQQVISHRLIELLRAAGYDVHEGEADDRPDLGQSAHWFTWAGDGMSSYEVGDGQASLFGAWLSAAEHWFSNAVIPLDVADQAQAAPVVVIVMDGGLIQNVMSDAPVRTLVIDYDTEGTQEEVRDIPQNGGGTAEGLVSLGDAENNPEEVAALLAFAEAIERREKREAEAIACSFSGEARRTMGRHG